MRVKICCIASIAEAQLAIRYGAHAVGLVSEMLNSTGVGVIPDDPIREIATTIPPEVRSVLLTSRRDPDLIATQQRETRVDAIQLVERINFADLRRLRAALPGITLLQVVHVTGTHAIADAAAVAPLVDAVLLDSGRLDGPVRELGGTGRVHDWEISARIVAALDCPVFLAGGLRPGNVEEAIRRVRPFGVDVCSGLRPDGQLDEQLLGSFFEAVRGAADG
jgi:phosphoribosylanthranilate isomerase